MKESYEYPPNITKIRGTLTPPKTAIFTYGDTIYNPNKSYLDPFVIAHETLHRSQQKENPEDWWNKYLSDGNFRLSQEIPAYQVQYSLLSKTLKNRDQIALWLHHLATDLSGEMYGNLLTYQQAKEEICCIKKTPNGTSDK